MSVKFRVKKSWEGKVQNITKTRLSFFNNEYIVWSGGMDSKLYEWDFSRGLPTNIYDMSKYMLFF